MRVLTANLGFPFTVPAGVLCASLQPRKRECLGFPFGHCSCDWGWRHSFFYSLWPVWNDYWLKVSVLLGCPSLGSLARENSFWGWGFFSSLVLMYFWDAGFSAPCLGWDTWDKKIQGTHHYISSRVLRSLATLLSLHLSKISCLFYIYFPGFLDVLSRKNSRKKSRSTLMMDHWKW